MVTPGPRNTFFSVIRCWSESSLTSMASAASSLDEPGMGDTLRGERSSGIVLGLTGVRKVGLFVCVGNEEWATEEPALSIPMLSVSENQYCETCLCQKRDKPVGKWRNPLTMLFASKIWRDSDDKYGRNLERRIIKTCWRVHFLLRLYKEFLF